VSSLRIDTGEPRENEDGQRRSWSQYEAYRRCAKAWQLAKLRRVPRRPGVWLAAGTAVHVCIEGFLRTQPLRREP
jgi:hypothetical protein